MSQSASNFSVNKENSTVTVNRSFAAPLEQVWASWTQSKLLDQWWAPQPYRVETKAMDFSIGGFWLYAMVSPENEKHWSREDYEAIDELKSYSFLDSFCDEDGKATNELPRSFWTNTFTKDGDRTLINIVIKHDSPEDLQKILDMGFKDGFTAGLENLDALLAKG
ncbi:hypothetical protein D3C87_529080 [compost metagenome]